MKNNIIYLLSSIIIVLSFFLYFEVQEEYNTVVSEDSTSTTEIDSIPPPDTVYAEPLDIPDPDTVYIDTTNVNIDSTEQLDNNLYFRDYTTSYTDTLLDATIETTVQGFLINQELSYTPNYPIQINTTVTNRVVREITRTPKPKPHISVGLDVGSNKDSFTLAKPSIWYYKPNGNAFGVGYDIVHRAPTIGIRYNLRNIFK